MTALMKLPEDAAERRDKMLPVLLTCIRVPEAIAAANVAILELCDRLVNFVNHYLLSDLAVCSDSGDGDDPVRDLQRADEFEAGARGERPAVDRGDDGTDFEPGGDADSERDAAHLGAGSAGGLKPMARDERDYLVELSTGVGGRGTRGWRGRGEGAAIFERAFCVLRGVSADLSERGWKIVSGAVSAVRGGGEVCGGAGRDEFTFVCGTLNFYGWFGTSMVVRQVRVEVFCTFAQEV